MNTINELISKAIKVATSPFNFVYTPTRRALMDLSITPDGPVSIKWGLVTVPINFFRFSTYKTSKARVILHRDTLAVKEIIWDRV